MVLHDRETHPNDRGQEPTILNQPSGGGGQLEINLLLSDFIKKKKNIKYVSIPTILPGYVPELKTFYKCNF